MWWSNFSWLSKLGAGGTLGHRSNGGDAVVYADELLMVGEVGVSPVKGWAGDEERWFYLGEQDRVIDGVKGCCKVEKKEDSEVSRVRGKEKVICQKPDWKDSERLLEVRWVLSCEATACSKIFDTSGLSPGFLMCDSSLFEDRSRAEGRVDYYMSLMNGEMAGRQFIMFLDGMGSSVQVEVFSPDRMVWNCSRDTGKNWVSDNGWWGRQRDIEATVFVVYFSLEKMIGTFGTFQW